jgi:hypothetical protein
MPETPDWSAPVGVVLQPAIILPLSAAPFGGAAVQAIPATAGRTIYIVQAMLTPDYTAGLDPTTNQLRGPLTVTLVGHTSLANLLQLAISPEQPLAWPPIQAGSVFGGVGERIDVSAISAPGLGTQYYVLALAYYLQ